MKNMKKKILIIDDEASIQESLSGILEDEGFLPVSVSAAKDGLELLPTNQIDLILLDIWLGEGMDGLTALEKIKSSYPHLPVIMISGHGTIETAVQATKKGAFDFIEKPLSYEKIVLAVNNGLKFSRLEEENRLLRETSIKKPEITGNSPLIAALKEQIKTVGPSDAWVLIRGDHGTGKELVAQSIHRCSGSSSKPMIEVNCAAIPEELIESELFGHEKGSFTGAHASKRGKFDLANNGILFLDEIGDMSLKTQAKILRILQEQKFERVGGSKTIKVNVRVLAATNKNLEEEIEKGNFRADLFWRLNVVPIMVPKLKDRLEDIPLLVESLLISLAGKGLKPKKFSSGAHQAMMQHDWPGNVRELRNFVERMIIMCPEENIEAKQVCTMLGQSGQPVPTAGGQALFRPYQENNFKQAKKIFESEYLKQKLEENSRNISRTAEQVGMERSHLHKKLKSLAIIS